MCIRYFGFFLLICFPGVLHGNAQSAALSCSAPKLDDGYFVPEGDAYAHETKLVYACDEGYKPVVDGWWAESTCQNGKWSHEPLCIDENACFMPDIRNGKHKQEEKGWYADGSVMEITCDKGYEIKRRNATPTCRNGKWISESVCKKSRQACGEPPKVSHAVVINQGYQDVFAEDSEVQYECEDGFTAETDTKTIICRAGTWTAAPTCSRERIYSTTTDKCGRPPTVPGGEIVEANKLFLKYQCNSFYKQLGHPNVVCYSDGTWSKLPTCKANFCVVDTAEYPYLVSDGIKYIADRQNMRFDCVKLPKWYFQHYSVGYCTARTIHFTECCNFTEHTLGMCTTPA
ncbi:hypothetical protein PAMA_005311 [Pampus argenteus]